MKFFSFFISLILYSKIFSLEENIKERKKNKNNFIIEHYFKSKIKKKTKNNIIRGNSDDLSYNFDFWERIQYKNIKSNKNNEEIHINLVKDKNTLHDNYNNEYIHDITKELNVINGDYKTNDLLTKFNNRKFNEEEEESFPNLNTENLPNSQDKNDKYKEMLQKNKIYQNNNLKDNNNYEFMNNMNNFNDRDTINNINNINNLNYMNNMNNRHHRGIPHGQYGKSTYFDSQSTYHSSQQNANNFQSYNTNKKSRFGGYFTSFYQIIVAVGFFGLIYRLLFGNRQNDKFAMGWYESNIDYFKERYELIGLVEDEFTGSYKKPEADLNTKSLMVKESSNNYQLICGNYRYIKYISINLHFMKKYDMNFFITSFFHPTRDKITYQVSFNSVDPCGWVFCITSNRQSRGIKQGYEDLNSFCEIYHPHFMSDEMCLISEDENLFKEMFNNNKKLWDYYRRIEYFIDNIYYSDSINSYVDENNIYFTFDIDLNEGYQERIYLEITHFVNLFVDSLAQIKYTEEFKKKVKDKREQYRENKIRENMKEEIEAKEKKEFIERFKNQMKDKKGFGRKKVDKKSKKKNK